jgi:hypothetical protein
MADADYQTQEEIKKLAHEWLDAARGRDKATLDRILADDFIIAGWQPGGRLADKEYYVNDCLRPVEIQGGSYHFDNWKIRIYDNVAVVICTLDIRAIVEGHDWGGEVLMSDVWLKYEKSWRVVSRHTSPIIKG